jgi:hypothetical protein
MQKSTTTISTRAGRIQCIADGYDSISGDDPASHHSASDADVATAPLLDWFHIGMRLQHLKQVARSQGDAFPLLTACRITADAPTTSTLRNPSSPARVITPSLTLPAVERSFGVKPIQLLVAGFRRCRAGERDRSGEDPGIAGSRR